MLASDEAHWWYRGRRAVLKAVLDRLSLPRELRVFDAGCGSGRTLDDLASRGTVCGVDTSPVAVAAARRRGHSDLHVASVQDLPFDDRQFDLITCLDVIEHTPDDRESLAELLRVTRPGGALVVTVPAYTALFSAHDVANGHYRRYDVRTLAAACAGAGWGHEWDTYFNTTLLAPAAAVRIARRHRPPGRSELSFTPRAFDAPLTALLRREAALIAAGRRLPFGLSLLMVLRRPAIVLRAQPAAWRTDDRVAARSAAIAAR